MWQAYRNVRNSLKTTIKKAKRALYNTALSSKKPKEVWQVINRILNPNSNPIRCDPNEINKHFVSTAYRTLKSPQANNSKELLNYIRQLPDNSEHAFHIRPITYNDVLKELRSLRPDTSTGPDQIPVRFIKIVSEFVAGPVTHIINSCIEKCYCPRA